METKLEMLISVLKLNDTESTIIDNLIIDYYNNQDATEFNAGFDTYTVFTSAEREDILLEIASDRYYDYKEKIIDSIAYENNSFILEKMIDTMNMSRCIDIIYDSLSEVDIEDTIQKEFVIDDNFFYVYKHI